MQIGPFTIGRTKTLPPLAPLASRGGGWFPWGIVRESFTGAWQTNVEIRAEDVLTNPTLFAVVTLIASDIAKLTLRLVEQDRDGIWSPIESAAFSPVLRKPNHYQLMPQFVKWWMISKLTQGNTYVLLQRDQRRVVRAMYILDPSRVTPLVTPSGDVYYELRRDDLSVLRDETVTVPASEIMHDRMVPLFHPLIGVTPIYACGASASHALTIASNSDKFFSNGSTPGGVLTAPGEISEETAQRLKATWTAGYTGDNYGKIAVLGSGLQYVPTRQSAVDSQLIDQLHWSDERICSTYHVPPYMVGVGPPPPYANVEPLLQAYYSQCLQDHITDLENCLDAGMGIREKVDGQQYGTEFDIDDLIWMDAAARTKAAGDSIGAGALSPNEARKKYLGLGKVTGGESCYLQQQYYSLEALAQRDAANPLGQPALPPAPAAPPVDPAAAAADMAASLDTLHEKALALSGRFRERGRRAAA